LTIIQDLSVLGLTTTQGLNTLGVATMIGLSYLGQAWLPEPNVGLAHLRYDIVCQTQVAWV